jgi:hypothetical protein
LVVEPKERWCYLLPALEYDPTCHLVPQVRLPAKPGALSYLLSITYSI